jgi:hypothetical protein
VNPKQINYLGYRTKQESITYIHIYTHAHTYIYTHTHTYILTYTHIHTYIHTHTHTKPYTESFKLAGSGSWLRGRKLPFSSFLEASSAPRHAQGCRPTCCQSGSVKDRAEGGGRFGELSWRGFSFGSGTRVWVWLRFTSGGGGVGVVVGRPRGKSVPPGFLFFVAAGRSPRYIDFVMITDALASVHVLITLTLTYLLTFCQHADSAHAHRSVTLPRLSRSDVQ